MPRKKGKRQVKTAPLKNRITLQVCNTLIYKKKLPSVLLLSRISVEEMVRAAAPRIKVSWRNLKGEWDHKGHLCLKATSCRCAQGDSMKNCQKYLGGGVHFLYYK